MQNAHPKIMFSPVPGQEINKRKVVQNNVLKWESPERAN